MTKTVYWRSFCVLTFGLLAVLPAGADVRTWDDEDAANSYWSDPDNWDPNGYSNSDDLIVLSGAPTAVANVVTDNGGSITLDGATSVADFGIYNLYVADTGEARMDILNAADLSSNAGIVGFDAGSQGDVVVTGAGSTWANRTNLFVGYSGTGTLTINDAGAVSNSYGYIGNGGSGNVTVSGAGSTWATTSHLSIGLLGGTGTLTINDGGTVSNSDGFLGNLGGASGNVTVSGPASTWANSGSLYIGKYGTGTLTINDGGAVSNGTGYVGDEGSGDVTVSGTGSTWTNSSTLFVGENGAGMLTINNGGSVSNTIGYIGEAGSGLGDVTVTGANSTWANSSALYVGRNGAGTLTIAGGGTVSNRYGYIGDNLGSSGDVTVSGAGSTWHNTGNLYVGSLASGTLTITDGGTVSSSDGSVGDGVVGSGHVTVSGAGSTWANSGSLYVAKSGNGTLTITGGTVSNISGYVGDNSSASGDVTVTGIGSTWANSGSLYIGNYGTGTLTINDGGTVSNSVANIGRYTGSEGNVTVAGAASTWTNSGDLEVGHSGTGILTIGDGGAVSTSGSLMIAALGTSTGTVDLQGGSMTAESVTEGTGAAAFNWTGGTLSITGAGGLTLDGGLLGSIIGINHNKGLSVTAATTVNSGVNLAVTGGTFSTSTLSVAGTAQLYGGTITIGDTFAVNSGGVLEIAGQNLVLLTAPTLEGDLALDQTTISVPSMIVASGATLDLDSGMISATGAFTNNDVVRMGTTGAAILRADTLGNSGALLGQGSIQAAVTNTGNIALSGDSSFTEEVTNQAGGKIIVSGGSAVTFFEDVDNQAGADISVSSNCTATYFGSLSGTGSFSGTGTSYIEGDMRPGASPGAMAFGGDVVFGSLAGLEIELGGTMPGGEFDTLDIAGAAMLDGTLDVRLIDQVGDLFEPNAGDSFEIITATGGIDGTFARELLPGLTGPLAMFVHYEPAIVTILATFTADFDEDGDVDGDDFLTWQAGFGTGSTHAEGDADFDQDVDGDDFLTWQTQFGSGSGSASAAVPEPTSVVLLLVALVACAFLTRRQ